MKLEKKISLAIAIIFLTFGALFLLTGFSIFRFLNNILVLNKLVTYFLLPLLFIGGFTVIGLIINRKIRKPLTFFIRWIDQLSLGIFKMPDTINKHSTKDIEFGAFSELKVKLDGLTNQLKKAEEEGKELEETRRKWTAGVTHDLKTPLSYIKGYATMLRSEHKWSEDEIKEFANIIEEKSLYMEQLIDDLSVVYEFEKMQIPVSLQTANLVEFVKDVLDDFQKNPMSKDYPLYLDIKGKDDILLSFDPVLLKRALENFIMNAISHNPIGTTVKIILGKGKNSTTIEINDNGIGMDKKIVEQLFNQYYRGITTDKSPLGSGLGMSIAKQFIEKQGGEIKVESELGKGTNIKIKFPEQ
ncbi:MAG: HAMP domain-containing sensor histidine kinase [Desulfitobacteriaceae bacterium]|nr:HAMP domain-containing sensor histidine kinase [Desulfitobacteriaceae bacterium]